MPFARVRDTRTWYELRPAEGGGGTGRLLFVSGSGGPMWPQPEVLAPLLARFDVLAYEKRGLGRTEAPATAWTMADYAGDADALLGAAGWEGCRVLGVSFGGMIAQELAIRHPRRVERLALCCTSPGGAFASYPLHELADLPAEEREPLRASIADVRHDAAWQAAHPQEYAALAARHAALAAYADADAERRHRRLLAARAGMDALGRLHRIATPTLVAGGVHDGIAPVRNQRALRDGIPGARLELFGGGHGFLREDPRAAPAVAAFLADAQ